MRYLQHKTQAIILYCLSLILGSSIIFFVDSTLFAQANIGLLNAKQFFGFVGSNSSALLISLVLIVLYSFFAYKKKLFLPCWFALVGAVSNLISRVYFGGVPDYINLLNIPTFNLADIFIVVGLLLSAFFLYKKDSRMSHS